MKILKTNIKINILNSSLSISIGIDKALPFHTRALLGLVDSA